MRRCTNTVCHLLLALVSALLLHAHAQSGTPGNPRIPYVPTPQEVVDRMLQMASVTSSDLVYDLGSGDGRIVIQAAEKFGARGVGVEYDPPVAQLAIDAVKIGRAHV